MLRDTELRFKPDHGGEGRPARLLSDGQRSLLHLALTTAALDIETQVADGSLAGKFDMTSAHLPTLTVLAIEEPENSLAPFYLSRIISQVLQVCGGPRAQAVLVSHSASVLSRIDPASIRHFRLDTDAGTAAVRPITLPDNASEAGKYVREAVRAHPELYFAQFVVLGEGDTEELVIPAIAQARGIDLDPSFVAMVPLGGRHTNHFWKLLTDLHIPFATLLDLDYGRADAGPARLRIACQRLADNKVDVFADLDGFTTAADLTDTMTREQMLAVMKHLRQFGVFFSHPLDLDMAMLDSFWKAYTELDEGERGPHDSDATKAVLGSDGSPGDYWAPADKGQHDRQQERLRWYRYLFLGRSKPSTHLRALVRLSPSELRGRAGTGMRAERLHQDEAGTVTGSAGLAPGAAAESAGAAASWEPTGIAQLEPAAWDALRDEGCTAVVAGPGAGKTEFLAQRAAFLLQTGTVPRPAPHPCHLLQARLRRQPRPPGSGPCPRARRAVRVPHLRRVHQGPRRPVPVRPAASMGAERLLRDRVLDTAGPAGFRHRPGPKRIRETPARPLTGCRARSS